MSEVIAQLGGWAGFVVAVLGIIGLLASATAFFRASYAKATVTTLAESNAALKEQVAILKDQQEADEQERAEEKLQLATRLEAVERENATLREVVQGKADMERVVMVIQDHHHEVIEDRRTFHREWRGEIDAVQERLADILSGQGEVGTSLKAVRSMVGKVYAQTIGDRT